MMQKMKHRGPNDEGIFLDGNIGFGFLRLSILDLSLLGHQPMFDESKKFMIIHNGEVYNYLELRNELEKKGYKFKSNTDTEVILYSFIEWGENCLNKFNGMWAFAIYNLENKNVFISRDRFGVKPLYYVHNDKFFAFSSEIKPLLSILENKPKPNEQLIFDFLVFNRSDYSEETFFEPIKKLQHGHCININKNNYKIKKWYDLNESVLNTNGFQKPEEFRDLLNNSILLRLRSDVPVGVNLSGGLDSSSIMSLLIKNSNQDIKSFSAIYGKNVFGDESKYIYEFKDTVHNMFFIKPNAETLANDYETFIYANEEPIPDTSPYAQFKVMELAKENVVVLLNGQGADEQLGGYKYFFGSYFKELLYRFELINLFKEIKNYIIIHKDKIGIESFVFSFLDDYVKYKIAILRNRTPLNGYFKKRFIKNSYIADKIFNVKSLNEALLNHFEYKLEHLLKWEDRNSMWFSLETRLPFLDYRLVEKTLASNAELKIKNGMTKVILRDAMKDIMPENIRNRVDKVGFATPLNDWLREPIWQKIIYDVFKSKEFKERNIVNTEAATELYRDHLLNKVNAAKEIWKVFHLELWFRKFID
jgi:asparagine synthase (glutamine-hydrolysing)